MRSPGKTRRLTLRCSLLLPAALCASLAQAQADFEPESAADVNEGSLLFLPEPPRKAVHHHRNVIRIDEESLRSGWVNLSQCHDHLDAVPRAQITFRDGFVRDLRVDSFASIGNAWIEGATVQLLDVTAGAKLCLSAQTRALRHAGNGYYNLSSGPYMRRFLDGYYPMRVTLEIEFPPALLSPIDISPPPQPGLLHEKSPGAIRLDAVFEGVLQTLIQFEKR